MVGYPGGRVSSPRGLSRLRRCVRNRTNRGAEPDARPPGLVRGIPCRWFELDRRVHRGEDSLDLSAECRYYGYDHDGNQSEDQRIFGQGLAFLALKICKRSGFKKRKHEPGAERVILDANKVRESFHTGFIGARDENLNGSRSGAEQDARHRSASRLGRGDDRLPEAGNGRIDAAGIDRRGPYNLRHTFATEALAAGISIFELSRLTGTSVGTIDKTYGHLAVDSEDMIRARLDARGVRSGDEMASAAETNEA